MSVSLTWCSPPLSIHSLLSLPQACTVLLSPFGAPLSLIYTRLTLWTYDIPSSLTRVHWIFLAWTWTDWRTWPPKRLSSKLLTTNHAQQWMNETHDLVHIHSHPHLTPRLVFWVSVMFIASVPIHSKYPLRTCRAGTAAEATLTPRESMFYK